MYLLLSNPSRQENPLLVQVSALTDWASCSHHMKERPSRRGLLFVTIKPTNATLLFFHKLIICINFPEHPEATAATDPRCLFMVAQNCSWLCAPAERILAQIFCMFGSGLLCNDPNVAIIETDFPWFFIFFLFYFLVYCIFSLGWVSVRLD